MLMVKQTSMASSDVLPRCSLKSAHRVNVGMCMASEACFYPPYYQVIMEDSAHQASQLTSHD